VSNANFWIQYNDKENNAIFKLLICENNYFVQVFEVCLSGPGLSGTGPFWKCAFLARIRYITQISNRAYTHASVYEIQMVVM